MPIRGVIFDFDGTLVDSGLDFELMRREMGLASGLPVLEALAQLPPDTAAQCWKILGQHEHRGSQRATLFPGVRSFLAALDQRGLSRAIVTRNSRPSTLATLARLELDFSAIMCREDAPAKPDPTAIWMVCEKWGLPPQQCVMIGDYCFDLEAGRRAGTHTVLFTGGAQHPAWTPADEEADFVLQSFDRVADLWKWWAKIDLGGSGANC